MTWEMNLNTMLTLAGFSITLLTGYGAYTSFKAETVSWKLQLTQQVQEVKQERTQDVLQMRARADELSRDINMLSIQDARQMEQIAAMLAYLQRIERTLDALVKKEERQ